MPLKSIDDALQKAYQAGCMNILALRGDPPIQNGTWEQIDGGFNYATDLIKYIRKKYGSYFNIGVAGYPEGHPEESNVDVLIDHLKLKVDAGADFIVTQMFYDAENFIDWCKKCQNVGINIPIIPGIMPISTYASFMRRAKWCEIKIPDQWYEKLDPIKDDDMKVRQLGTELVGEMCRKIIYAKCGVNHLHFYTMNLEKSVMMLIDNLESNWPKKSSQIDTINSNSNIDLPWRQSLALNRQNETVRPIFWKNRKFSYISRTQDWDEFPNGRWGDSRSPAFGELDSLDTQILIRLGPKKARELWSIPTTVTEIGNIFIKYLKGEISSGLPWSDGPITPEIDLIKSQLIDLNSRGLLTINSQPALDGIKSNDKNHGWGPNNGYVYQKAYLELFVPLDILKTLIERINLYNEKNGIDTITYHAVNIDGNLLTNTSNDGPNAVTWGIYPGREVLQPTVVEKISFLAWKDEAFRIGLEWANMLHDDNNKDCTNCGKGKKLITNMMQTWYLINVVNNDYKNPFGIFELFSGLHVE